MTLFFLILLSAVLLIWSWQKIKPIRKPTIKPTALSKKAEPEQQIMAVPQRTPAAISVPQQPIPPIIQSEMPPSTKEQLPPSNLPIQ